MDAYNANPSSMRASLEHFLGLEAPDKVLILGDMRELGEFSQREHEIIVEGLLPALRAEKLRAFFVGEHFGAAVMAVGLPITTFQDVEALKAFLQTNPLRGRTVLIKGSRGMALEKLYDLL